MDQDQRLLDDYDAREEARKAAEWRERTEAQARYENAARAAHKIRRAAHLLTDNPVGPWEDLALTSQRHLIADAEVVAKNPSITERELRTQYQVRLVEWGDPDSPDLAISDRITIGIEEQVLAKLKEVLHK